VETWLVPLLGGIGVALLGLVGTVFVQWMTRDKVRAEAKSTDADYGVKVTQSAINLVNELQDEIKGFRERQVQVDAERKEERAELIALRAEVASLRTEVEGLRKENFDLRRELSALKMGVPKS
jgi:chromosome segregation ATPase